MNQHARVPGQMPAPAPAPIKKGKSPWMWVGVGCLGVVIVSGIAAAAGGYFLYSSVAEDPVGTVVKIAAMGDPDIEFVETDVAPLGPQEVLFLAGLPTANDQEP